MALSREFVTTLNDWIKWQNYNRKSAEAAGLENRVKFLEKANHGLYFIVAAMADELARIDGGSERDSRPNLLLPVGTRW